MTKLSTALLLVLVGASQPVWADAMQLRCFYTEATYDAPFMNEPAVRECPEQRCYYDIAFDTDAGVANVNGLPYQLSISGQRVMLSREAANPVMGGMDKASFSIDLDSKEFRGIRDTAPDVRLTLQGQCSAH